ncbi:MAG: FAD-dependent oxidoreductase [Chloroflexi bacterium]|nr:MAG: FAD-dependent oxidoreductase [Chloroflexota bacterium]
MEDRESLSSQMRCRWFMLCSICEHQMHLCRTGERELMEKYSLHVSIIGGGIGGLATASALQRQGIQVTLFERNPELREIGAGLTLWANGVQMLRQLGLADALAAVSAALTHFECWSWRGKRLGSMRLDTIERRVGAPSIGIHRADLLRLLAGEVSRESVHVNAHCVGFRQEQGHVISHFADGQQHQADLLVGADGLYSVIREQLLGQQPPRYSGYTCWRGVAVFEERHVSPGISSETWGRGRRFGMLPIGNGRVFWYATYNCPAGGQDQAGERKSRLSQLFGGWREPIEQLIEATDEGAILRNDILDRRPVRHWGSGRVTLLGDAAHPPTPNLGQGACQALEDALVLAGCLADQREPVAALHAYEARRMKRSAAIIKQSSLFGKIGQWEHPLLCALRDGLTPLAFATFLPKLFVANLSIPSK